MFLGLTQDPLQGQDRVLTEDKLTNKYFLPNMQCKSLMDVISFINENKINIFPLYYSYVYCFLNVTLKLLLNY